jgi:hypothetical protein
MENRGSNVLSNGLYVQTKFRTWFYSQPKPVIFQIRLLAFHAPSASGIEDRPHDLDDDRPNDPEYKRHRSHILPTLAT